MCPTKFISVMLLLIWTDTSGYAMHPLTWKFFQSRILEDRLNLLANRMWLKNTALVNLRRPVASLTRHPMSFSKIQTIPMKIPVAKPVVSNQPSQLRLSLSGVRCPSGTTIVCQRLVTGGFYMGSTITKCTGKCGDKSCSYPCVCICRNGVQTPLVINPVVRNRGNPSLNLPAAMVLKKSPQRQIIVIVPGVRQARHISGIRDNNLFSVQSARPVPQCAVPLIAKCTAKFSSGTVNNFCAKACQQGICPLVCHCFCSTNLISSFPTKSKPFKSPTVNLPEQFALSIASKLPETSRSQPANDVASMQGTLSGSSISNSVDIGVLSSEHTNVADSGSLLKNRSPKAIITRPSVIVQNVKGPMVLTDHPVHQDIRGITIKEQMCPTGESLQCKMESAPPNPHFSSRNCLCFPDSPCPAGKVLECKTSPTQADMALSTNNCQCVIEKSLLIEPPIKTAVMSSVSNQLIIPEPETLIVHKKSRPAIAIPESFLKRSQSLFADFPKAPIARGNQHSPIDLKCHTNKKMLWCDPTEVWVPVPGIFKWCNVNCGSAPCDHEICTCRCVSPIQHEIYHNLFISKAPYFQENKLPVV